MREPKSIEQLQRGAAMGQMVEEIAHELGNSLGALGVLVHSFRSDPRPDGHRLDVMDQAIESMLELLRSLTELGAPEPRSGSPVSIGTLLAESADLIRLAVPGHVRLVLPSDVVEATVQLSKQEFQQVLLNLVMNACAALPGEGTISICSAAAPEGVCVSVTDTGTGMDAETLRKVFDRHYSTKSDGGSGLGLTVSRQIVERIGGRLDASSEPNGGSTFTMTLPSAAAPARPVGSDSPRSRADSTD